MLGTLIKTKDRVKGIMEAYPATRDCDATLYLYYLAIYFNLKVKIGGVQCHNLLKIMKEAPPPESMRRVRQKLQEEGELTGTKREQRLHKAEEVRYGIRKL